MTLNGVFLAHIVTNTSIKKHKNKINITMEGLLNAREAAEYVGVTTETLRKYRSMLNIEPEKKVKDRGFATLYFSKDVLDKIPSLLFEMRRKKKLVKPTNQEINA